MRAIGLVCLCCYVGAFLAFVPAFMGSAPAKFGVLEAVGVALLLIASGLALFVIMVRLGEGEK